MATAKAETRGAVGQAPPRSARGALGGMTALNEKRKPGFRGR